jgi:hypothetical protein
MPKRKIALDVKVHAMQESLHLQDVEAIAGKYGLSERSMFVWFDKVKESLPEILQAAQPGPKGGMSRPQKISDKP